MRLPSNEQRRSLGREAERHHLNRETTVGFLRDRGIPDTAADTFQLGIVTEPEPGLEYLSGWLSIPYLTPAGVLSIKYRCTADHNCKEAGHQKYLYAGGQEHRLYNTAAALGNWPVIALCEGELDAIAVQVMAGLPALAYPGVAAWGTSGRGEAHRGRYWARCFTGFQEVLVIADGDDPGRKAAEAIVRDLPNGRVVRMPDGHDANSFIVELGAGAFRERCGI